jgi:trans-aconitate 2-methyltransferase
VKDPLRERFPSPQRLYDALNPWLASIDLWHTHYHYILDDHQAVIEWVKGTGLRPYIDSLADEQQEQFLNTYLGRVEKAYPNYMMARLCYVVCGFSWLGMVGVRA